MAKTVSVERVERRNPGRADGVTWNANHYICGKQIEGDSYVCEELDTEDLETQDFEEAGRPTISISLADMIRPGKPKRSKLSSFSSSWHEPYRLLKANLVDSR